jgi:hypothetical protein
MWSSVSCSCVSYPPTCHVRLVSYLRRCGYPALLECSDSPLITCLQYSIKRYFTHAGLHRTTVVTTKVILSNVLYVLPHDLFFTTHLKFAWSEFPHLCELGWSLLHVYPDYCSFAHNCDGTGKDLSHCERVRDTLSPSISHRPSSTTAPHSISSGLA